MDHEYALQSDFQKEVLEASHDVPIVVDFWAEWCGPCRILGPVLERLAAEAGDGWRLVKVDTEQFPDLAMSFGIQGIPAVKMFHAGQPIAEFVGALPELQVRDWLQRNLPRGSSAALGEARQLESQGDEAGARQRLEQIVGEEPENHAARLHLVRLLVLSEPARARELAAQVPAGVPEHDAAAHFEHLARLLSSAAGEEIAPAGPQHVSPEDVDLYRRGAQAARERRWQEALQHWIELLQRNRTLDDDGARRACLALFALLGEDHEVTTAWRRRFSMALSG